MHLPKNSEKIYAFEFVLKELLDWHARASNGSKNDFSTLKVLKLLFFVSAANTNRNSHSILLEDVFNNYYAMPYGHVESDIYDSLKGEAGVLNYFTVGATSTEYIQGVDLRNLDRTIDKYIQDEIQESIYVLILANPGLILWTAFDLVDLSHAWSSWQTCYSSGSRSTRIPADLIKKEEKFFNF